MLNRQLQYLRPDQILPELQRAPLVYLPLGLLEWHGPHLPLGVDAFNAEAVALRAAEISGGLVLPTLYCGTERERDPQTLDNLGFPQETYIVGMDFPANSLPSMYAAEEIFALMVREQVRLALHMGFRVVVLVSGHGAVNQLETLKRLAAEFNASGGAAGRAAVLVELAFSANEAGVLAVGHASRIETAIMQTLHPETVRLDLLPERPAPLRNVDYAIVDYETFLGSPTAQRTVHDYDDPRLAQAAEGEQTLARTAAGIATRAQAALKAVQ